MKAESFENDDVKSVTNHPFQSKSEHLSHAQPQVSVVFIVFIVKFV